MVLEASLTREFLENCLPLFADHQNCKRTWYGCALRSAAAARRWGRRRSTLLAHGQDVIGLAIEGDGSGAIHRLKILLDIETRWTLFLDDRQGAVAVRAEGFHRRGVEHGAIRTAGERQARDNLAVFRAQDDHHGLCWLDRRIPRIRTRRKEHMILRVQRQPIASALVSERIVCDRLHGLDVDGRDTTLRIL